MELPSDWFRTPEGRNKWIPVLREKDAEQRAERQKAKALLDLSLSYLPAEDAALVRRVYTGL